MHVLCVLGARKSIVWCSHDQQMRCKLEVKQLPALARLLFSTWSRLHVKVFLVEVVLIKCLMFASSHRDLSMAIVPMPLISYMYKTEKNMHKFLWQKSLAYRVFRVTRRGYAVELTQSKIIFPVNIIVP